MSISFLLSLRADVKLKQSGEDRLVVEYGAKKAAFGELPAAVAEALRRLAEEGGREDELTDSILNEGGAEALAGFYYCLRQLSQRGLLLRSVYAEGRPLATLVPISPYFNFTCERVPHDRQYVLSRFAYWRAVNGEVLLESPLSHARLIIHDKRAATLLHALAQPQYLAELCISVGDLSGQAVEELLTLYFNAQMLSARGVDGTAAEDEDLSLRSWEFHDLLFHTRSREGRHDLPSGGTYRFFGTEPPAARPRVTSGDVIELFRPEIERLGREDPNFTLVHEARRSIREYDRRPLSARQLGEFLYRVGRVTSHEREEIDTPYGPVEMEFAQRPYPSGGAMYECELYALVNSCEGLSPGLYHYDAQDHRLLKLPAGAENIDALLLSASDATAIPAAELQVLIIITARYRRIAWKYSAISYSLILKDVGVIYQTMYLAATAMGLAPCAVGTGNADLFARALNKNYYEETSVGEFLIGNKLPDGDVSGGS